LFRFEGKAVKVLVTGSAGVPACTEREAGTHFFPGWLFTAAGQGTRAPST
jgi:hypothetical protein